MTTHRSTTDPVRHHDVVIIGGGNAGISLAAKLRRDGFDDVAVIEPDPIHRYRPLFSYVGGGQASVERVERPQRKAIPRGVRWYRDRVSSVDPVTRTVHTDRRQLVAGDLVVCPGVSVDWDAIPGSHDAVFSEHGSSNYVDERARHTWELIRSLTSGRAVFAVDDGVVPCAGAALKPLFLAADHWRRTGVLDDIEIDVILGWDTVFGIPTIDDVLGRAMREFGIRVHTRSTITGIDAAARTLEVSGPPGDRRFDYDLLHVVPRHRAPQWIADSDLAGDDNVDPGMVAVVPTTLAHRRHARVWGLGDAADVDASRSGGALRKQVPVVAANIARQRAGRELIEYTGYTTHPITVSRRQVVLAEFDRTMAITPSVPVIDLTRPRMLTWAYDLLLQPQLYWRSILAGRVKA